LKKIKDRIIVGSISGVVASIPIQVFDPLMHKRGITDVPYGYYASSIFSTKNKTKTPAAKALSVLINFTNSGLVGTAISYTLSLTGKDKAIAKGAGIGTMMWVGIAGLLSNVGLNIQSKKPITPLISFAEHVIFGATCSYLITKIGDDSLFPDKDAKKQKKIPIVFTGQQ